MKKVRFVPQSYFGSFVSALIGTSVLFGGVASADFTKANVRDGDGGILETDTRTLDTYTDYVVNPENLEVSRYGGWKARQVEATGFFRTEKIGDRWWVVDPEGYLYIAKHVNSVGPDDISAGEVNDILQDNGFNGTGRWSDDDNIIPSRQAQQALAYAPFLSFLGEYDASGSSAGLDFPVFDDEFQAGMNEIAEDQISEYVDDPAVFGYMSDNEIGWYGNLEEHLDLSDTSNENYITAMEFLEDRGKTPNNWDEDDEDAYVGLMAEAFYSAVSSAIRRVDPNHMYLGSRANSGERYNQAFMEAAGKYVDIFSMNHYSRWGAYDVNLNNMERWLGKPMMLTEFYAQQVGINDPATGAGFRVADQVSRGRFYQNYVTTSLENKNIVGFHWFKFEDDGNGNKGIVDEDGNRYEELLELMNEMHVHTYDFIDYVDSRAAADETLKPEADAYYINNDNFGDAEDMRIEYRSGNYERRSYMRFDVSQLNDDVSSAVIELKAIRTTGGFGTYEAELVENDTWGEMTINRSNSPPGSTLIRSWHDGADLTLDVTDEVRDAVAGDGKLSIRISSEENTFRTPYYGARENDNSDAHPTLSISYTSSDGGTVPVEPVIEEPVEEEPVIDEPVTSDVITIFDFSSFNTARDFETLGVGVHTDLARWDNDISSIAIPDGLQVTACDDAAGTTSCVTFTSSVGEMSDAFHNKISYLLVEANP